MQPQPIFNKPVAYGGQPNFVLASLSGKWIPFTRIEEIKNCVPKRFGVWTSFLNLDETLINEILEWRLRINYKKDEQESQFLTLKTLSIQPSTSDVDDEDVYIVLEVSEREDGRLTEEEMNYIRELEK